MSLIILKVPYKIIVIIYMLCGATNTKVIVKKKKISFSALERNFGLDISKNEACGPSSATIYVRWC